MQIDLFTFIAQLINFLVLVWLLKRFLYKPILKAVDEREKHIAMQIQEAETLKKEATIELDNFKHKNNEFDQHRQGLLNTAINVADSKRQKLLEQTHGEIENLRLQLQENIKAEQQNLSSEIINRTRKEVFSIVKKTLQDLASTSLEDQMTVVFINRIKNLDSKEKDLMLSEIRQNKGEVLVRYAFEPSPNQQVAIKDFICNEFFAEAKVKFETDPKLVSGIELVAAGYKLVWSIEDYLVTMENSIGELLSTKT